METDADGVEWQCFDGSRRHAVGLSGTAGFSDEDVEKVLRGEIQYTEVRPAAWDAKARLVDMDTDHIDLAVLYPTSLLGLQSNLDVEFGTAQARAYNDWCADHVAEGEGRLFGAGALPPMHHPEDVEGVVAGDLPGSGPAGHGLGVHAPESRRWNGSSSTTRCTTRSGPPPRRRAFRSASHPFLAPDLPGVCQGLRLGELTSPRSELTAPNYGESGGEEVSRMSNIYFTQAISNPFDVMSSLCFLTSGGVCERFPELKLIFLEANGGWLVPWLERLDHHTKKFPWDVPWLKMLPSEYFRRQCWISFDPDEAMLATTALSPLVGAERIIWASDYPHPDAKFPGVTKDLAEAMAPLTIDQRRQSPPRRPSLFTASAESEPRRSRQPARSGARVQVPGIRYRGCRPSRDRHRRRESGR